MANTSPEPFSNILLSLFEDAFTIGASFVMTKFPILIAIVVVIGLVVSILLFGLIRKAFRKLFGKPAVAGAV
jgi:uncharacterized membrane protein